MKQFIVYAKERIPEIHRIEKIYFTSIVSICDKLYINHPQNMNHVHKYGKDLLSFIITLVKITSVRDTVFYDGVRYSELRKISHVIKNLHGRWVVDQLKR